MSNPSVTATVSVDDKASPRLRELLEMAQKLSRLAKTAFEEGTGSKYAAGLNSATTAAKQHLTVLEKMHKVQSAIFSTAAGVAGAKAFGAAKHAVSNYIPYERDVRYQRAIQGYSDSEMALLEKQRVNAAATYGLKPEDTLHAQQAFVTRSFSAAITEVATKQAIILSKALNIDAAEASKIVEGITFASGTHLDNPADADRKTRKSADIAAMAAKAGAMSAEDISQFAKFGVGMSSAAGIDLKQAYATAMTLKRANVGGDESGVFMRQMSARLLAPTKQAHEAFAHMGIDYSKYAPQGNVSPEAIDASLRRRYGKGLSDEGKANLNAAFNDESRNVLGNRESFTAAVREAVEAGGEKLSKIDQKHLVDTALRQYDLAKGSLRGGELFDEILSKASHRDIQAILGDKQGGRAVMLLSALEQYREYLEKLKGGDGYAEKIATERMQGLAAAVDRFSASIDVASKQVVAANERWLTPIADAGGRVAAVFTGLSDNAKVALSAGAGLASLAGMASAGSTVIGVISSLTGLSTSANVAAAALTRISAGGAVGTAAGAAGSAAAGAAGGAAARGAAFGAGLGSAATFLGWTAAATMAVPAIYGLTNDQAQGVTRDRSRAMRARAAIKADADERMMRELVARDEAADLTAPGPTRGRLARLAIRADAEERMLREVAARGDANVAASMPSGGGPRRASGWQDTIAPLGQSDGFGKTVSVTGTVNGQAELHQNMTIKVEPTPYFMSLVQRAEAVANMSLNGTLGTSMQGPGGNNTKGESANLGTQK